MSRIEEIKGDEILENDFLINEPTDEFTYYVTKIDEITNNGKTFKVVEGNVKDKPFKATFFEGEIGYNKVSLKENDFYLKQNGNYWNIKGRKNYETELSAEEYYNLK